MTGRFVSGLVGQPFGLEGFVRVSSLSGERSHLLNLEEACLRRNGREERRRVAEIREYAGGLLFRFEGVDSPEAARSLKGAELLVDRADAAPLGEGEFYVEDLTGLSLVSGSLDGPAAAVVTAVVEGGGGELLEVRLPGGEVRLVPFRGEFIGEVDLEGGRAVLLADWILE